MSVEIRMLNKPEEYRQARVNSSIAFNYKIDLDSAENEKPIHNVDVYGAFENGKLVSHIYAHKYEMAYYGKYIPMCGVGSVCTLVDSRNKGYIRQLFHTIFDDIRKSGYVYSYLYPFSHMYYNKFGYGYGGSCLRAELPIERLGDVECTYDVKMYQDGDSYEPYNEVFEKFARNYTGTVARKDSKWLDNYITEKTGKSLFLFSENNVPKAFMGYENFYDKGGHLLVHTDVAWDSPIAFRNMLGFIYRLRMHNNRLIITLPESFPIELMMSEQWGVKLEREVTGQVRVIDVASALRAYPWPDKGGTIKIGVRDDYYADQCGVFSVSFCDGKAEVEKSDETPDIEMDIRVLSPLLFGVYGFEDLAYFPAGMVDVKSNTQLLSDVFRRRQTFITEQF